MHIVALQLILALLVIGRDTDTEESGSLTTAHSQQAMGRTFLQWLREIEVIRKALSFLLILFLSHHLRGDDSTTTELATNLVSAFLALAHHFGNDILSTLQGSISILHLVAHKLLSSLQRVAFTLEEEHLSQRFQASLTCNLCTSSALRFKRKIDILQFCGIPTVFDALLEGIRQFTLFLNSLQDSFLTFRHLLEFLVSLSDGLDIHLIHISRFLLTVTGDKRNGASLFEKLQCILNSLLTQFELGCNNLCKLIHNIVFYFCECKDTKNL